MLNGFKRLLLLSVFSLLIIGPTTSFAWRGYGGYWNYPGSGRDYPYSYVIDEYYSPGYAQPDAVDIDSYINDVPPTVSAPLPVSMTQVPAAVPPAEQNEFTVNIPNDHGGYTAVLIKRSGNGFTGPQGEYYPEFPKVSQLKIMYGK